MSIPRNITLKEMKMQYNFKYHSDIDHDTLDYLAFVTPEPIESMSIHAVNKFLTELDRHFLELQNLVNE